MDNLPPPTGWNKFWDNHIAAPTMKNVPPGTEELPYGPGEKLPLRYKISWVFAVPALLAGMVAWGFDVLWVMWNTPAMGILGFLSALVSGVCVFIGEVIAAPGPKPSWFSYATWLSLGSIALVTFWALFKG